MGAEASHRDLLLLGASGQVGRAICAHDQLAPRVAIADRTAVDLSDPASIRSAIRSAKPRWIVNAAAYTNVELAEDESERAFAANAVAPRVIAEEAQAVGAAIVHYSTDYVFDGKAREPYPESAATAPLSVYAASKLEGERGIAESCERHVTIRTSWVYSEHGKNFLKTVLRLALERDKLTIVDDETGVPTAAHELAAVTAVIVASLDDVDENDARWGLYHYAAAGATSRHAYAKDIVTQAAVKGFPLLATPDSVMPVSSAAFPMKAERPGYSVLSTTKIENAFGIAPPPWQDSVGQVLERLKTEAAPEARHA